MKPRRSSGQKPEPATSGAGREGIASAGAGHEQKKPRPEVPGGSITPAETDFIDRRLPAAKAWRFSEHVFQVSLVRTFKLLRPQYPDLRWLHAIPNGGNRDKVAAGKMKAEGQQRGVPDLSLPVPRIASGKVYHGLWLELKKAGGCPSPDQWDWLLHLHRSGYAAHVVNDPETARKLVTDYLSLSAP